MDERGSPPSTSRGRKRRQHGEDLTETDNDDSLGTNPLESLEDSLNFSDTLVALRIMRAQFPCADKIAVQPFVLRSQIYSSVSDRTQVDREIESLRRSKVLRVFKLNTGQDDHGIMFLDDYLKQIDRVVERMEEKKIPNLEVFQWFKLHVLDSRLDPNISHQELCSLLSLGGRAKDEHISLLINGGVLSFGRFDSEVAATSWQIRVLSIHQLIDPNMYWFAIPNVGSLLKGLNQGRKELLSLLIRKKYKEMLLAALEKKKLHLSPLDMRFHLRDLIGSGHLKTAAKRHALIPRNYVIRAPTGR